jgi:hypothetical protein
MVEKKYIELINKEIDGVNLPRDRIKLKEYLKNNPEAQNLYDDLVNLSNLLHQVDDAEPSPNLKKNILNSIPWEKQAVKPDRNFLQSLIRSLQFRFNFNLIYAFSAGLIAGIIIYTLSDKIQKSTPVDISRLTGTFIIGESSEVFEPVQKLNINLSGIDGTFNLKSAKGLMLAELYLRTQKQVEVVLEFDEQGLDFSGFRHLNKGGLQLNVSTDQLKLTHVGDHKYIFVFRNKTPALQPLHFNIFSDGALVYEKTLYTETRGSEIN